MSPDPLAPVREKIDALDSQIVERINQRLALAAEIGRIKRSTGGEIYVPEREEAVLRKVCGQNPGPIGNEALRAIYREIMSAAIALEKPLLIAYLGPESGNAQAAAMKKFGASVDYHAMASIDEIFTAVEKGDSDFAVIPIENSTAERVGEALDRFVESDLKVIGQSYLEVSRAQIPTRFFILGRKPAGPIGGGKDITSLLVSLGNETASHTPLLLRALGLLVERGLSLSKIESRPSKKRPWDHYLFIDIAGHYTEPQVRDALDALKTFCPLVKWLGSYPSSA